MSLAQLYKSLQRGKLNVSILAIGELSNRAFSMLASILIARALGETKFGLLSWCLAVVGYASIAADAGLAAFGTREVARNPDTENAYLVQQLRLKNSICVFLLVALGTLSLVETCRWWVLMFAAVWLLPMSLNPEWLLQGQQRIATIGVLRFSSGVILLAFSVAWTYWPVGGIIGATAIRAIGEAVIVATAFTLGWSRVGKASLTSRQALAILERSLPLAGSSILTGIYSSNFDILLLGYTRSDSEVGIYAAAFRLYLVTTILPKLINVAAFPRFAANSGVPLVLQCEIERFIVQSLRFGLPIVILSGLLAPELIAILYGPSYESGATVLKLLTLAGFAVLLNAPFPSTLLAAGKTKLVYMTFAAAFFISMIINILATPRWGMLAAAIAVVLAETVVLIMGFKYCQREFGIALRPSILLNSLGGINVGIVGGLVLGALNFIFKWHYNFGCCYAMLSFSMGFDLLD